MMELSTLLHRRRFLSASAVMLASLGAARLYPSWARSGTEGIGTAGALSGNSIALTIAESHFATGGRSAHAITVNGTLPAPLIRLREGQTVQLAVTA